MALFYVTGLSGSGKSAVLGELVARGYEARGVDEDEYADWVSRVTGAVEDFDPGLDFHAWCRAHDWVLSPPRIGALREEARARPVYLCGGGNGVRDVWHLFDKVVALIIDVPTLRQRIAADRPGRYGQAPEEMAALIGWHETYKANHRRLGALTVDATQPLTQVVDDVLAVCAPDFNRDTRRPSGSGGRDRRAAGGTWGPGPG